VVTLGVLPARGGEKTALVVIRGMEIPKKEKGDEHPSMFKRGIKKPISTTLSLIYTKFI
jgi:hypothetical protein